MTLTRPSPGDPLSLSNGKSSTEIMDEYADLIESHDLSLIGPTFASADAYPTAAELLVKDVEGLVGWVAFGTGTTFATSNSHTLGSFSVQITITFTPGIVSGAYFNLPSDSTRGNYTHFAADLLWQYPSSSSWQSAVDFMEFVVSDAVNLGGNVVSMKLPEWRLSGWKTPHLNVSSLSAVRSFGIRTRTDIGNNMALAALPLRMNVDNVRWAAQTELERAMTTAGSVVVPASYTPAITQALLDVPADETVLDLRGKTNLTKLGGVRNVRDFMLLDETGVADSTQALTDVFAMLNPGDTLEFPPDAKYRLDEDTFSVNIRYLTDVTIDARGAVFYSTVERDNPFFLLEGNRNLTLKNFRVNNEWSETINGANETLVVGTPVTSGTSKLFTTLNDETKSNLGGWWSRDKDRKVDFVFRLSDSAQVAGDCKVFLVDTQAPTTALVATVSGTDGPVPAGLRYYRCSFVDSDGQETALGVSTAFTGATNCRVNLTSIPTTYPGTHKRSPVIERRIYRTEVGATDEPKNFHVVGTIRDSTVTTFTDAMSNVWDPPSQATLVCADIAAGNVEAGLRQYRVSFVDSTGHETVASGAGATSSLSAEPRGIPITTYRNAQIQLTGIPLGGALVTRRRIYRTFLNPPFGDTSNAKLVGEIADNTTTTFTDNIADASLGVTVPECMLSRNAYGPPVNLPSMTLTLTSTPTDYHLTWVNPERLGMRVETHVKKMTATANTITYAQVTNKGRIVYHSTFEGNHGFDISNDNYDVTIEGCDIEGVRGDAVTMSQGLGWKSSGRVMVRDCLARGSGRQGMSFNYGGPVAVEDSHIRECPRSGIDLEPETGAWPWLTSFTAKNLEFRNVTNSAMALVAGIPQMTLTDIRIFDHPDNAILGNADGARLQNIYAPWSQLAMGGRNMIVENSVFSNIVQTSNPSLGGPSKSGPNGGFEYDGLHFANVRITSPSSITFAGFVDGLTINHDLQAEGGIAALTALGGPFNIGTETNWSNLDPAHYQTKYPSTIKGVGVASKAWFPRGHDLLNDGLLQTRALSNTSTRGNNLRGINVAVTAGVTTQTVAFPTQPYLTLSNATFAGIGTQTQMGTLTALTTYFYRIGARSVTSGPATWMAEKTANTTASGNGSKTIQMSLTGIRNAPINAEAITILRGTAAGVYTVRYDLVPTADWHWLTEPQQLLDLGAVLMYQDPTGASGTLSWGYPAQVTPTSTTHQAWDGAKWTVADESGWEPNNFYAVWVMPSWPTTVSVTTKRMNGFDLQFGVACPVGGGTLDWFLVR